MKYLKLKFLLMFFALAMAIPPAWAGTVIDEILAVDLPAKSSTSENTLSYTAFTGKTFSSTAVYAGKTANLNSSIAIRSKNSDGGIVTTASGGKVRSITIKFNSSTTANRKVDIYGKNTAYQSASDLHDAGTKGELLGTAQYYTTGENAGTQVVTIDGNYSYVGIRSNSGTAFIDKITIVWETEGGEEPTVAAPTFSLEDGTYNGAQNVTISCGTDGATIYYSTDEGATWNEYTSTLTISQTTTLKAKAVKGEVESEIATATYTITYNPVLTVGTAELTINDSGTNNTFSVKGENLVDNIGVTPVGFEPTLSATVGQPRDNWDNGTHYFWFERNGANVDGSVAVNYAGTELYAEGTITMATKPYTNAPDEEDITKTVTVYYRPDIYILGDFGNGWNFNDPSHKMTFNGTNYTATVQMPANSYFVFARKLTESSDGLWNDGRSYFGPSYNDWPVNGNVTNEDLALDQHNVFKVINEGEYTITIDPEAKKFSIVSTNIANIADAQAFTGGKFTFTGNAVVTYQNGEYMWIRDVVNRDGEVNSGLIKGSLDGTFTNGDVLKSGWKATKNVENTGVIDFINPEGVTLDVNNGPVAPYALTELTDADINKYVSMSGLTVTRVNYWQYTVTADGTNTFYIYDQFHVTDGHKLEVDKTYNVVGVVSRYNGDPQLYLISAEEVKELKVTLTSDTKTAEINKTIPVTVTVENAEGNYTVTYKFGENGTENTLTGETINVTSETAGEVVLIVNVTNGDNHATATETYTFTEPVQPGSNVFVKVTNADQLVAGKKYIFVYGNYAMGTEATGSFLTPIEITGGDEVEVGDDVAIMTLGGTSGQYTLALGDNYLHAVNSTSLDFGEETKWSIAADSNGANDSGFRAKHADYGRAVKKHNSMARFGNYSTGDTNSSYAWIYVEKATAPQPEPLAITLTPAPAEPYTVGDNVTVTATVENGSENTEVTYKIGEGEWQNYPEGGIVLPNTASGDVVVTVKASDGTNEATDEVTYHFNAAEAFAITLTNTPDQETYKVNDVVNVKVTVAHALVENPTITYSIGETREATTYNPETGINVTSATAGTVTLTVNVTDGFEHAGESSKTATYTFNKKKMGLAFEPTSVEFYEGQEVTEPALKNLPEGDEYTVAYRSNNEAVATVVASSGEVTAVAAGEATITAKFAGNDVYEADSASYTITVLAKKPAGLAFVDEDSNPITDPIVINATVGDDITEPTVFTNGLSVSYSSDPESVATVDENGNVTIEGPGTATITISTEGDETHSGGYISYTINAFAKVATPTFSPEPQEEAFTTPQSVTIACATEGAKIYYNINSEANPTAESTLYEDAITVGDGTTTIKAIAIAEGMTDSEVATATYTVILPTLAAPVITPESGEKNNAVEVTITPAEGAKAYYMLNDAQEWTEYTEPFTVDGNEQTIKAIAKQENYKDSPEATATYTFAIASLTFTPAAGTFNAAQNVEIATETEGAKIEYSINDGEWTEYTGAITVGENTTIKARATKDGYTAAEEPASATYVIELPVVAAPTFSLVAGTYGEAQQLTISAENGANILYSTDGSEPTTPYNGAISLGEGTTTVKAVATKDGFANSPVVTATYIIDIPEELPTITPFKGYYQIKNNGNGMYANIAGRKTLNFTNDIDKAAGTVIRLETDEHGKVDVLRSQAADLQRYADRVVEYYVPKAVELVVKKLRAEGAGNILGENGLDAIMDKFNESFDHHLYVEPAEGGYRIYGKTPSMQPVVDFYREHTAQVEAKLPMLESFINSALDKLKQTIGGGGSIFQPFSLLNIWERMGGTLTKPEDDASIMAFYREVLNNKNYVWDFAYQTATFYLENLKNHERWPEVEAMMGEYAQYFNKLEQVRPDFKYYIVADGDKPDFISEGNVDINNNAARTIWTVEPRTTFTVNVPENNKLGGGYEYVTTLYTDFAYDLPEGVTAYKVTGVTANDVAELEAIEGTIPAQTPVLLKATTAGDKVLTLNVNDGTIPTDNLLVGPDFLINYYDLTTPQLANLFQKLKEKLGEDFYNSYVKDYEYLMKRNSGTVNNKYFWNVNADLDKMTNEPIVRDLAVDENGKLAFSDHWTTENNKAFLVDTLGEHNVIYLSLRGDITRDGLVNISDVTALIDILLELEPYSYAEPSETYPRGLDYEAADFNLSGVRDIADVTALIDFILLEASQSSTNGN